MTKIYMPGLYAELGKIHYIRCLRVQGGYQTTMFVPPKSLSVRLTPVVSQEMSLEFFVDHWEEN